MGDCHCETEGSGNSEMAAMALAEGKKEWDRMTYDRNGSICFSQHCAKESGLTTSNGN